MKDNPNSDLLNTISGSKWEKIGTRRRAGAVVPLFSVFSKNSSGIGDFADLKLIVDWAHDTGNSIIQLLPMNEVGPVFCPYDSISSFALEPAYASFSLISQAAKEEFKSEIEKIAERFPAGSPHVDYRVKQEKLRLLRDIFIKDTRGSRKEFLEFKKDCAYWLKDLTLFKALKDHHHGGPWYDWEEAYKNRDKQALDKFAEDHEKEIEFQGWLQWQLYKQFREVKKYAQAKGVLLKGDLPILASFDSADVWSHPEYFKLGFAAGAPADMYCEKGQRWGTPTYNWDRIAAEGYAYLKEKLKFAENFYDILRIDHVVGLFRIWSIPVNEPMENKGFNGFFDPAEENRWGEHGRTILKVMLESTAMLLCAEDLGVIPMVCTETLKEFGIPGNEVMRWVKDWQISHDFLEPKDYRAVSVAMLSTHDTTNWAAWWENEAGTIDEALFVRKCRERGIDYNHVKDKLFDLTSSRHARLRWLDSISSSDILACILGRRKEEVMDFIDMYENSYLEKEKLWKHLGLAGGMREKCDQEIITAALKMTLDSRAVFCIQLLTDWLGADRILKGDPYQYRINTPGTVDANNWSVVTPIPLEDLSKHKVCRKIKKLITDSERG